MNSDSEPEAGAEDSPKDPAQDGDAEVPASTPKDIQASSPRAGRRPLASTSGIRYSFSSLGNPNFLLLWLGMMCLMGGTQMQMMARGYLVYDLTNRPLLLGLVNASSALPILTLSLFGGAIADRVNRKRIVQAVQVMSMLVALVIGISIYTGAISWVHLLIASVFQGAMWSFMMPARQAMIPEIVGPEHVTNGLALNAAGMSAMTLMAPVMAGTVYGAFGPDRVYFLIAALNLLAIILTSWVKYTAAKRRSSGAAMLDDIRDGLSYIGGRPLVLLLLVIGLAITMLAMPFRFLVPVYVVEVYDRGPEAMGLLVSMMGVGTLAGALAIVSLGKWRRGMLLIMGTFMSGVGLVLVAAFPYYLAAVGIMVLIGLGDSARRSLNQTLIIEVVDDQYRGRVMSVFMMNFGVMPLGVLPAGLLMERLGEEATIAILGAGVLVVATVVLATQKRLRDLA